MKRLLWIIAALGVLAGAGLALWLRERRARTVFPASQAASLLHPARRLIQPPGSTVAAFCIESGQRVLEIGPGPGYFTVEAAAAAGAGGEVICVDLQPGMIAALRQHVDGGAAPRVRMLVADAMRLPFAETTFDRAFLVAVLGEVPDPARALAELRRVLRPGGIVSFCETLTDPDYIREGTLRRACEGAGLQFVERKRQPLGYIMRVSRP